MKFDMTEAWRQATAMIGGNREVLLVIAGLFFFLPSVAMGFALGEMQRGMFDNAEQAEKAALAVYAQWWWLIVLAVLAAIVGYLTLLALLRAEHRPTVGQALRTGLVGLLPAVGTYLIFGFGLGFATVLIVGLAGASGNTAVVGIATALCVVGAVAVGVRVSLAGPVIAIDKVMNPFRVLARSWRLTARNTLRLVAFYLLLVIAYFVLTVVAGIIVSAVNVMAGQATGTIVNALLTGLLSALATTVFVAVLAAVHRQLAGPDDGGLDQTFG